MHSIHLSTGKTIVANDGETLLDAGLRTGVALPYSCRTGRCSTCRGRVTAGATVATHDEFGLEQVERAAGWVLTCVRQATSDVHLEVEDLGNVVLPTPRTLACRIHVIERFAPDVARIELRLPPTAQFRYLPGQYIDVIGPGGIRRSYSIANADRPDKRLELHVRQVEDGAMSRFWFGSAKADDLLRLHGPLGTFFLRDAADKDLVFLATGTGIAPIKAILESLVQLPPAERPRSTTVYWGGRKLDDLYWTPGTSADRRFVPVLSRADAAWTGARGHVQDVFMSTSPDLSRTVVYACGSDAMIRDAHARLVTAGLPDRHFSSDAFVRSGTA